MTRQRPSALRLAVHAGTGLFALALGLLPAPWHVVAALAGVVLGFVVFPLTGLDARLRRPGEGWWNGVKTYPLAVLGLVLFLPRPLAAAAWGVLALGDAAAAWVGSRVASPALFGHPKGTWSGTLAHVVVGALAAWGLQAGVVALDRSAIGPGLDLGPPARLLPAAAAALAGAIASLVPVPPDDNLPTAAAAGLALAALA